MKNGDQSLQSLQYNFPYHYIPSVGKSLSLSRHWPFASSYVAALRIISDNLSPLVRSEEDGYRHIDIGCGDGALISYLRGFPAFRNSSFSGVDIDERSIGWARMFNSDADLHAGDMKNIQGTYSSATLVEVLEHVPPDHLPSFLQNASNLLKPGGMMLVTVPSVEKPVAEKHYQHFSFEAVRRILEPCFEKIEVTGFEKPDLVTRFISRLRTNRWAKIDAPFLNEAIVGRLSKLHRTQQGCGRIFAKCFRKPGR